MSPNDATASASSSSPSSSSANRQDSQYIGNSSNGNAIKINYEVFLPIVFALAFMLMLFLVYICNNVDVRGLLRRQCFCCCLCKKKKKKSSNSNNASNKVYNPKVRSTSQNVSSKLHSHQELPNVINLNNYAKSHEFINDDETKKLGDFMAIKTYRRSQNVYASAHNAHMPMQAAMSMPSHRKFVNHPNAGFGNFTYYNWIL
jgi:hypothetical protein